MTLYECESEPHWHGYSSECSSKNMPDHLTRCRGGAVIAGWAVGGEVNFIKPQIISIININVIFVIKPFSYIVITNLAYCLSSSYWITHWT